ncbi:MAG: hypothetical protein ABIS06_03730 [Vicinamibacterales bacterium]
MKTSLFQRFSGSSECLGHLRRERKGFAGEQPIDIESPEADSFHVERDRRAGERLALHQQRVSCGAAGLLLNNGDETRDLRLGFLAVL